jgi:hypothetical protein
MTVWHQYGFCRGLCWYYRAAKCLLYRRGVHFIILCMGAIFNWIHKFTHLSYTIDKIDKVWKLVLMWKGTQLLLLCVQPVPHTEYCGALILLHSWLGGGGGTVATSPFFFFFFFPPGHLLQSFPVQALYPEPCTRPYGIRIYCHCSSLRALTAGRFRPTRPATVVGKACFITF